MQASRIETSVSGGLRVIRVTGAGTFANGQPVQAFGLRVLGECTICRFDLRDCLSLDSTFIGVMALLAIRGREQHGRVEIANASERVQRQVTGLGIGSLFTFVECAAHPGPWQPLDGVGATGGDHRRAMAQSVIAAHETLGRVNPDNVGRFQNVIDMLKREDAGHDPDRQS